MALTRVLSIFGAGALALASCATSDTDDGDDGGDPGGKADGDGKGDGTGGGGLPFLVVGHRGAPWAAVENTLPSYTAALREGANAIEIDLCVTSDHEVLVWHDCNPNDTIALARQAGAEGLPYIPDVPGLFESWRTNIRNLTLAEAREHYGYAPNNGIFDNIFDADPVDVYLPTLDEVAAWARSPEGHDLKALFLDIKLTEDDLDLVPTLASKAAELFADVPYKVYSMTPREPVVVAFRDWYKEHAPEMSHGLMFDFEKAGALEGAHKYGLRSLSTGKTVLRGWGSYLNEIKEIVAGATAPGHPPIDAIVAWTIDNENWMLALADAGIDGMLSNRPGDLARMLDRQWADHDLAIRAITSCFASNEDSSISVACASGASLELFGPLREDQLVDRACAAHPDEVTQDVFGCGGLFDAQNVTFERDLRTDQGVKIWWDADEEEVFIR